MKTCEFCNNEITDIICSYCGNDTSKSLIRTALTEVNEDRPEKRYCENCGAEIKRKNCLFCRINLIKKENNQPVKRKQKEIKKQIKKAKKELNNVSFRYSSRYRKRYHRERSESEIITIAALCGVGFIALLFYLKYLR